MSPDQNDCRRCRLCGPAVPAAPEVRGGAATAIARAISPCVLAWKRAGEGRKPWQLYGDWESEADHKKKWHVLSGKNKRIYDFKQEKGFGLFCLFVVGLNIASNGDCRMVGSSDNRNDIFRGINDSPHRCETPSTRFWSIALLSQSHSPGPKVGLAQGYQPSKSGSHFGWVSKLTCSKTMVFLCSYYWWTLWTGTIVFFPVPSGNLT